MNSKKIVIASTDSIIFKLKVLLEEKEVARLKLIETAKQLAETAEKLKFKTIDIAVIAKEKEVVRLKLIETTKQLAETTGKDTRDIAALKRTEHALEASHTMLQNIINFLPIRIFWKDINLNYLGGNASFAKDAGKKSPQELIGKSDFDMAWKAIADSYRTDDAKVINSGIPKLDYEETLISPTGETLWVNTNKVPLKDANGKIIGILGTYTDITQRKKNEAAINLQASALQASADAIVITDTNGIIQQINSAFTELAGYTASDVIGQNISIIKSGKQGNDYYKKFWANILAGKTVRNEIVNKRKDGSLYDEEETVTPVKDKTGKIIHFISVKRDITERKKAEDILRESEHRYRVLVDVAPLCIKWFDATGNLVSVNKHGKEEHFLVGKSDEEIRNWHYMDCIEEKYRDMVKAKMADALAGKSSEFDMEHVPGTSTGHWCHSYLVPATDDKGKISYVLFISRDFTTEKNAEEEKNKNIANLEKFKELTVDRELRMIELKKQIDELKNKS